MGEYIPPASLLRGLPVATAQMMGMPCLGAHYAGRSVRSNRLDEGARCAFCGRPATNAHHAPPVGMGGRNARLVLRGFALRPALVALCGSGTTGCHGDVHAGRLRLSWRWDDPEDARRWWEGLLLMEYGPASPLLYGHGAWVFEKDGIEKGVRGRVG